MTGPARFSDILERFWNGQPPARLGVAVSGGADSLALLFALHDWGRSALHAVTVDHRLRPASASEALHVEGLCGTLGVPHTILEWRGWDGRGNLQDQARRTRYALIADWARARGLDAVALGHTQDDQAETVLMRLARAAGVDGLAGMSAQVARHGMRFDRPFLADGRRAELRAYLEARGIRWVEDPSNEDEAFDRVKARRALAALEPLGIGAAELAEVAANMGRVRASLARIASEAAEAIARVEAGDVIFDRAGLLRQAPEIRRRLLAGALTWVASAEYPPRRAPLAEAERAAEERRNLTLHGCRLMVSDMTLRITREHAAVAGLAGPTDRPWDNRWVLDGPHAPGLEIRALGEAVTNCAGWRDTGLPRATLLASPAVWRGAELLAAPLAGQAAGWSARAPDHGDFVAFLIAH